MWRRLLVGAGVLCILAALAVFAGWRWLEHEAKRPSGIAQPVNLVITPGSPRVAIAQQLHQAGLVAHPYILHAYQLLHHPHASLKAGEYAFSPQDTLVSILQKLRTGDVVQHLVTIPEGLTSQEILAMLAQNPLLSGDVPSSVAEGSLLPETYQITRGASRSALVLRMQQAHADALRALWAQKAESLPISTMQEAVILASIVEKETAIASERGLVASVFNNRLRLGMRLQSDPTVIYGIWQQQGSKPPVITRGHLQAETPYNTYLIDGLPPAPIAHPGKAALQAVLQPPQSDYLYFVADGSGGHVFAKTLQEHNANVRAWRKLEQAH